MIDWTDDELRDQMRAAGVRPDYPQMLAEYNRRAASRQARWTIGLALLAVAVSFVSLVVAIIR